MGKRFGILVLGFRVNGLGLELGLGLGFGLGLGLMFFRFLG